MKPATWEHVRFLADNLERASAMKEREFKHELISARCKELSETLDRLAPKGAE